MSVITKDLGIATAYGYAKSKGYTGTEEEFAELMASYADVAQQAEAAAQDAEDAKDAAVSAKNDAQSAQAAAAGSAQTASTKAAEASNSAQAASGSATAAGNSATTAAGSASTAQTAAQTATNKASEASSSASAASTAKTGAETARTGAQTAQAAAETAQENAEEAAASVSASAAQIDQNTADIGQIKNDLSEKADKTDAYSTYIVETETGAIASFSDGADDVPVKDLTVAIEPVQSGSGDPSPSNVRPISGWTGANVTRAGGNLLNPVAKFAGFWAPSVGAHLGPVVNDYSSFSEDTIIVASPDWNGNGFASTPLVEGKQYKITGEINAVNPRCSFVVTDANMNVTRTLLNNVETGSVNISFTVASGEKYAVVSLINISGNTGVTFKNPSVSESGVYEPYQGETYEVDWTTEAGTVYGGTLDVTTGVLTVDRQFIELDGTENGWTKYSTQVCFNNNLAVGTLEQSTPLKGICSHVPSDANGDIDTQYLAHVNQYRGLEFRSLIDYWGLPNNEVSTWTTYLAAQKTAGTPVQICVYLKEPTTLTISPQTLSTLLGQNNVWADSGDVELEYRADTKLYIDKVLNA